MPAIESLPSYCFHLYRVCFSCETTTLDRLSLLRRAVRRTMAAASDSKSSFLASLSPWGGSRTASPAPKSAVIEGSNREDRHLRQSSGQDHSISLRPSPGLKHYPRDCPPLKPRWFYAVDIPKRKPFAPETGETSKSSATPKKHVPFSESDSRSIESAFQAFGKEESEAGNALRSTKVPVNDDFLFDVNIENRELEPAYWIGPVYEVRRGSWFYQESAGLRPCDENLANQLEEGYIKVAPWRKPAKLEASRSASQPRGRPTSLILDSLEKAKAVASPSPRRPVSELREDGKSTEVSNQTSPERAPLPNTDIQPTLPKQQEAANTPSDGSGTTYRLFGAYMNSIVTYQDSSVAWLSTDDFMSRMSSSVYGRFGPTGTKIVRGYTKGAESSRKADTEEKQTRDDRRKAAQLQQADQPEAPKVKPTEPEPEDTPQGPPRRSALERQLSSLAGIPGAESKEDLAEEARQEEEKEMENYGEANASEQGREIEHLVLVTHGVGQRLGLRLDSINFIHDVNTLRKTMKAVYESAPDLQALNASVEDVPPNCRIQVLPVCWRHLLDFPKQSVRRNRKELDLADVDSIDEEDYPSLADITVDGVPAVRNLITDLAMDVLLYQSAYREHIAGIVQRECNRIYKLFKERNPSFSGRVSLVGHSLGSAILFDILCRQKDTGGAPAGTRLRMRSKGSKDKVPEQRNFSLDFDCENFFCLGSPIAMFQMLKGRTIAGRKNQTDLPAESPFDPDPMVNDPFGQAAGEFNKSSNLLPITISSPKCLEIYNIFHPTDPIAYRYVQKLRALHLRTR